MLYEEYLLQSLSIIITCTYIRTYMYTWQRWEFKWHLWPHLGEGEESLVYFSHMSDVKGRKRVAIPSFGRLRSTRRARRYQATYYTFLAIRRQLSYTLSSECVVGWTKCNIAFLFYKCMSCLCDEIPSHPQVDNVHTWQPGNEANCSQVLLAKFIQVVLATP